MLTKFETKPHHTQMIIHPHPSLPINPHPLQQQKTQISLPATISVPPFEPANCNSCWCVYEIKINYIGDRVIHISYTYIILC
jgi:hypothetical protein